AAARRPLVTRCAELLGGEGAVPVEVELIDARVAPDLLRRRRPGDRAESIRGRQAPAHEPLRPPERPRGICGECRDHEPMTYAAVSAAERSELAESRAPARRVSRRAARATR